MTTIINFQPTPTAPFSFQATFDGAVYSCVVRWNVFGQRWYVSVYATDGTRILTLPLVGSPSRRPIEIVGQAQQVSSMVWTAQNGGQVFVVMAAPSNFLIDQTIVVSGATNTGTGGDGIVNGSFIINTWSDSQHFTFLLPAVQGVIGTIGGNIFASPSVAALTWFEGTVTAFTGTPLPFPVGSIVRLTIADCQPDAYNGTFECTVRAPTQFSYALTNDPGVATSFGTYCPEVNLAEGYFNTSALVWRDDSQQFAVSP